MRLLALALIALALSGCETTAEKSHRLEQQARHVTAVQKGLSIARKSAFVHVVSTGLVNSSEGVAVVARLRNTSSRTLREVPVAVDVKDARGSSLYRNDAPGLDRALVSVALLPAHGEATWIDDQVTARGASSAAVEVGEAPAVPGPVPSVSIAGAHEATDQASGPAAEGTVVNRSGVAQRQLVVYGVATRGGKIVAAGRAIVAQVPAHGSARFQLFFVGDPRGARLRFSALPSTLA